MQEPVVLDIHTSGPGLRIRFVLRGWIRIRNPAQVKTKYEIEIESKKEGPHFSRVPTSPGHLQNPQKCKASSLDAKFIFCKAETKQL